MYRVAVMVDWYELHPINLYVWLGDDAGATPLISDLRAHPASWLASGLRHLGRLGQHANGNRAGAAFQVCIKLRQVCRRNAGVLEYLF